MFDRSISQINSRALSRARSSRLVPVHPGPLAVRWLCKSDDRLALDRQTREKRQQNAERVVSEFTT